MSDEPHIGQTMRIDMKTGDYTLTPDEPSELDSSALLVSGPESEIPVRSGAEPINLRRPDEEAEANAFAMELLMPEQFVRDELAKLKGFDLLNDAHVKTLADKFKVGVPVMAMRLGQIKPTNK